MPELASKLADLRKSLRGLGRVAVAFSGGVDSSFLLRVAKEVLGDRVLALTVDSVFLPEHERKAAGALPGDLGVAQRVLRLVPLELSEVRRNDEQRCYYCKQAIFRAILDAAALEDIPIVCDGTNADDLHDYRPGLQALRELGVRSPLAEAGLSKAEIRSAARDLGLACWDTPACACLASRVPYGQELDADMLHQIDQGEDVLRDLGVGQVRVRHHGEVARIELLPADFPLVLQNRDQIVAAFRRIGFRSVALDLAGYRTGSLNPQA